MGHPMDVILALTCDREKLVNDVRDIASNTNTMLVLLWDYLLNLPEAPGWMKIIAQEEIDAHQKNMDNIFKQLESL